MSYIYFKKKKKNLPETKMLKKTVQPLKKPHISLQHISNVSLNNLVTCLTEKYKGDLMKVSFWQILLICTQNM